MPCSILSFRDVYNLNHVNGLLNSLAWVWRGEARERASLAPAIQAMHAAGQQASTSPAQRASSGTRPGGRTAILVERDADIGMGRTYEQMATNMPRELGVFRDHDEASAWLLERAGE